MGDGNYKAKCGESKVLHDDLASDKCCLLAREITQKPSYAMRFLLGFAEMRFFSRSARSK